MAEPTEEADVTQASKGNLVRVEAWAIRPGDSLVVGRGRREVARVIDRVDRPERPGPVKLWFVGGPETYDCHKMLPVLEGA